MATERSVAVAIDLDYALAQLLPAAVEWHNSEKKASINVSDLNSADWAQKLAGDGKTGTQWIVDLISSQTAIPPVAGATEHLKPLRKYFTLLAIADRPRTVEKTTREWLDAKFPGVFDKVLFVDVEAGKDDIVSRKKQLFKEFKVKIAVSADGAVLGKLGEHVDHTVLVGSVPWGKTGGEKTHTADSWAKAKEVLEKIAKDLKLPLTAKPGNGPKLARYTDDLISIKDKRPPAFYVKIVDIKFNAQKQKTVRLRASDYAISTAVQTAELLKRQANVEVAKISTQYLYKRSRGLPNTRVAAIEIVIKNTVAA